MTLMKCVVTGVAGFIGSHIAERLIKEGHTVIGVDDFSAGYAVNIPNGVTSLRLDIAAIPDVMLAGVDVIFHQAASKKNICVKNPARDMEVNGIGTLALLQQAVRCGVRKFVHASTGSVYGEVAGIITEATPRNPVSYYGVSKTAGETYVSLYNKSLNITILRYFHVWGERQESSQETGGVIAILTKKIKAGEQIIIHGDGKQSRVFTHVSDIVRANFAAWQNPLASGRTYNCASPVQTTIIEIAKRLMVKHNSYVPILYVNPLPGDVYNFNVDASRIGELGIEFTPITALL